MLSNQAQTQLILDTIPSLVFLKDSRNNILRVNQAVLDAFSLTREQVEEKHASVVFPWDYERFYQDDLEVLATRQPKLGYIEKAGDHWVRTDKIPIFDKTNEDRILVIATDITEQVLAQESVKISELKYRTLFEESPVMHANVSPHDATIIDCNKLLVEKLGYSAKSKLLGKPIFDIYSDDCQALVKEVFQRFVTTGIIKNQELALKKSDGDSIPVVLNVASFTNQEGEIISSASTWVDISEIKKYTYELERVNRDLEEFSYVASHDLKAPLRAIEHLTNWLEEDLKGQIPESSVKHFAQLKQRVNRMDTLLDDLLEYSRVGRVDCEILSIDLEDLIENTIGLGFAVGFAIELDLEVTDLYGKKTPLETVLRNLINNAVKHHDKAPGVISISSRQQANNLKVVIGDDGPGIPEALHDKVFTMFQTLKPRDEIEGSGMGLALVKKLVEAAGGKVWIESNQPRGTSIHFTWPMKKLIPTSS